MNDNYVIPLIPEEETSLMDYMAHVGRLIVNHPGITDKKFQMEYVEDLLRQLGERAKFELGRQVQYLNPSSHQVGAFNVFPELFGYDSWEKEIDIIGWSNEGTCDFSLKELYVPYDCWIGIIGLEDPLKRVQIEEIEITVGNEVFPIDSGIAYSFRTDGNFCYILHEPIILLPKSYFKMDIKTLNAGVSGLRPIGWVISTSSTIRNLHEFKHKKPEREIITPDKINLKDIKKETLQMREANNWIEEMNKMNRKSNQMQYYGTTVSKLVKTEVNEEKVPMKYCDACGSANADYNQFCIQCGTSFNGEEKKVPKTIRIGKALKCPDADCNGKLRRPLDHPRLIIRDEARWLCVKCNTIYRQERDIVPSDF